MCGLLTRLSVVIFNLIKKMCVDMCGLLTRLSVVIFNLTNKMCVDRCVDY